jgi:hypothetical protein
MVLADLLGDSLKRHALPESVFDLQAFEVSEMLVLHGIVSFLCAMRNCNGSTNEAAKPKNGRLNAPLPRGRGREEKDRPRRAD